MIDESTLSPLELLFLRLWRTLPKPRRPDPIPEHRFHDRRKWRLDFAWPEAMVAVELEGGVHSRGRHTRGSGFIKDCDKYNAAAELGWTVLRYARDHLNKQPVQVIEQVTSLLDSRSAG